MPVKPLSILTGINRPSAPSSGGMILTGDLYRAMPEIRTIFLGRTPVDRAWTDAFSQLITLSTAKRPHGPDFAPYLQKLTGEVGALMEKLQPDVIHAHYPGLALSLALTRTAGTIPIIAIVHGPDVMAADRSSKGCESLNEVAAASAAIVVPTPALADHVDRLTGRRVTDRLTIIPWGIPLSGVQVRDRPPAGAGPLSLVHAGRLDDNKSTITAIEALALTDQPHRLTVIGHGILREHLEQQVAELGLRDRVRFDPFLPRSELWRRLPTFDAFVFTTKGLEAFGLVLIEAQAHGLPVIYSDLPGVRETLGSAGVPYTPGDPRSLSAALDAMGQDTHRKNRALAKAALDNASRYDIMTTSRWFRELTLRVTR
ncbi:glycosyltransferase family 4 protein [Streptomyces sp. WAC08241]|uniref:glycosyltransferase family 4 protein n=1 Tax=Streptomyces sp. WAC08241 TaxID=2487421 RepID=UPI000F76D601|nr:glycosyltransferase family 4 protein [Streptomyces sp. WAC08241]RSS46214.1 glycosyltransferase [Streptomyces sp. WAC08241]